MAEINKDLLKSRIEVLRDALKDVQDTIRAQDRKASYIIAIEFFLVSGYIYVYKLFYKIESINSYSQLADFLPLMFFIISILFLFYSYNPIMNPQEVLNEEDKKFGANKFFIFYLKDLQYKSSDLADDYLNDTTSEKGLVRVIYIEILKLSKIRETKVNLIKKGNLFLLIGFVLSFVYMITFFKVDDCFVALFKGCL